jgi:hypothetical protein
MGLQPFEGRQVLSSGVKLVGASTGLNKALIVDDLELPIGEKLTIAVEVEVRDVDFTKVKDTDGLQRIHVLNIENATRIDADTVAEAMEAQRLKIEERAGVTRLPYDEAEDDAEDVDDPDDDTPAPVEDPV